MPSNNASKQNESTTKKHNATVTLLPELLLLIMKVLERVGAKRTLCTFMQASKECYLLGLPVLWEKIVLIRAVFSFQPPTILSSQISSLVADKTKLSFVRELVVNAHGRSPADLAAALDICLGNLRSLEISSEDLCWDRLYEVGKRNGAPLLRRLKVTYGGLGRRYEPSALGRLPSSLRQVTILFSYSALSPHKLWELLNCLPHLERLDIIGIEKGAENQAFRRWQSTRTYSARSVGSKCQLIALINCLVWDIICRNYSLPVIKTA